ncbi:MAG TPA: universal stress protein [Myxococcales bacterium]|nr:universal stress protein [Myxococcales bacterium]
MGRILVGVDGSAESNRAAHFAKTLARATGRGLVFAHVLPAIGSLPEPPHFSAFRSWQRELEQRALAELDSLFQRESSWGLEPETELLEGHPVEGLAQRADEADVDMLVVGHRGRGTVARALLGSVADRLVQVCSKPVLVVR